MQTHSDQSECPKMPDPQGITISEAYWIARCSRYEALVTCIKAAYDTPSWIGEAIDKVEELNR